MRQEGDFENGVLQGDGEISLSDGSKCKGQFVGGSLKSGSFTDNAGNCF